MTLTLLDWLVIGGYFALNLAIGLYYARRARGSTTEFFLSGRSVPWWHDGGMQGRGADRVSGRYSRAEPLFQ